MAVQSGDALLAQTAEAASSASQGGQTTNLVSPGCCGCCVRPGRIGTAPAPIVSGCREAAIIGPYDRGAAGKPSSTCDSESPSETHRGH
jgi:hypothetical protein